VETVRLRRHDRATALIPATLFLGGGEHKGYIINISLGGCRLVLQGGGEPPEIVKDSEAFCGFHVPGHDDECYVRSIVRTIGTSGTRIVLGLKFENLEGAPQEAVETYVETAAEFLSA